MKRCSKCKRTPPRADFYDGRMSYCKTCCSAYAKSRVEKRTKAGLCRKCKKPAIKGRTLCERHAKENLADSKRRYAARIEAGMCARCGKTAPCKGKLRCARCGKRGARRLVEFRVRHKALGLCHLCNRRAFARTITCKYHAGQKRRKKKRRIAAGLCYKCSKDVPAVNGTQLCARHLNQARKLYNPKYAREWHLKNEFGITQSDFNRMLRLQGNRCAVCRSANPGGRSNQFHVDHNHKTGRIRALLCQRCNAALGQAREDPKILRALAAYKERHDARIAKLTRGLKRA